MVTVAVDGARDLDPVYCSLFTVHAFLTTRSSVATQYDVIVVGGGPAGYVCAIRAAQLGPPRPWWSETSWAGSA